MVHPQLGDETYEAVDAAHADALEAIGWKRKSTKAKTKAQVLKDVGDDPALAAAALADEQAQPSPRTTLIAELDAIANPSPED